MSAAATEFQGITVLDHALVGQLDNYLTEKETELVTTLATILGHKPSSKALFLKALRTNPRLLQTSQVITAINQALWTYIEILEGGVLDLFQQIAQTNLDKWDDSLALIIKEIVSLFRSRLDSIKATIIELDALLSGKRALGWMDKILGLGRSTLDRQLMTRVGQTQKFLESRFLSWERRYSEYGTFSRRAKESAQRLRRNDIFLAMPQSSQDLYDFVRNMVKIWEWDSNSLAILLDDVVQIVREKAQPELLYTVFTNYYTAIKRRLFMISRNLKAADMARITVHDWIEMLSMPREELHSLLRTVARYREFLLRTDPNPYVRSRWGFAEWAVGPEPETCRRLLQVEYKLEALDNLYSNLIDTLTTKPLDEDRQPDLILEQELKLILHRMAQPLTTRHAMQVEARRLIEGLQEFDELASASPNAIETVSKLLSKALQYDRKYCGLFGEIAFHKLYGVHHELVLSDLADSKHVQQLDRMRHGTNKILKWVKHGYWEKHMREIEQFVEDLQGYFSELKLASELNEQILEYRYELGSFYHRLLPLENGGQRVRGHFVGIDHMLDAFVD